jgi:hypothetical protein
MERYIMDKKSKAIVAAAVIISLAAILCVTIFAASSGTQADPLITLSYLNEKFRPQLLDEIKTEIGKAGTEITAKIDEKLASGGLSSLDNGSSPTVDDADAFAVVTLARGQTLKCAVGTELLLRIGTATASGASAPALVDETSGASAAIGASLEANHMYLVTIEGNGASATAATVKILVRGTYTIG